ncbi:hypothetical protein HK104_008852 [Borealophlyctis nickersoniae]|nr:hypothetical protein HK104_008852 [Borealophlyctis nickersoniae]
MVNIAPITYVAIGFNALSLVLLAVRCYHNVRQETPFITSRFRQLAVALVWVLLVSELFMIVRNPLMAICIIDEQCDPQVWQYGEGNFTPAGTVLLAMWIIADLAFYISCLLYINIVLLRLRLFQRVLRYPSIMIPILQIFYVLMCLVSIASTTVMSARYWGYEVSKKANVLLRVGMGFFFLVLAIGDISICATMVRTFERVTRELDNMGTGFDLQSTSSGKKLHAGRASLDVDSSGRRRRSTQSTIHQLRFMLAALTFLNIIVIAGFIGGGVFVPGRVTEISQIAESWFALHALIALAFLAKFKSSVINYNHQESQLATVSR